MALQVNNDRKRKLLQVLASTALISALTVVVVFLLSDAMSRSMPLAYRLLWPVCVVAGIFVYSAINYQVLPLFNPDKAAIFWGACLVLFLIMATGRELLLFIVPGYLVSLRLLPFQSSNRTAFKAIGMLVVLFVLALCLVPVFTSRYFEHVFFFYLFSVPGLYQFFYILFDRPQTKHMANTDQREM